VTIKPGFLLPEVVGDGFFNTNGLSPKTWKTCSTNSASATSRKRANHMVHIHADFLDNVTVWPDVRWCGYEGE